MTYTNTIKQKAHKPCPICGSATLLDLNGKYAGIWECQDSTCGVSEYVS